MSHVTTPSLVEAALIDRVSADDLMSLAGDQGSVPTQLGTLLVLETGADGAARVREALADRVQRIPRLRQRLTTLPFGQGRPIWVDDAAFDIDQHVKVMPSTGGGMRGALDLAATLITYRLPASRPLWSATIVPDIEPGRAALIVVLHHVLADGIAGMQLMRELLSPKPSPTSITFPLGSPTPTALHRDWVRGWRTSIAALPATAQRLASGIVEIRPGLAHRLDPTSLLRPTSARRRFVTLSSNLADWRSAAELHDVTINDVLLAVVGGSLEGLLRARGETPTGFTLSVPFSSRMVAGAGSSGNASGVMLLRIPGRGDLASRLRTIASVTRSAKLRRRAASTALLGPAFRALARLGLFGAFIGSQRSIHTIVSNVRGAKAALNLDGMAVVDLIPLSVVAGNITVSFVAASYAGRFTITVVADPETCPDLDEFTSLLTTNIHAAAGAIPQVS